MAIKGNVGVVKVGSATVLKVRSFSLEEAATTLETTTMTVTAATHVSNITSWTASIDGLYDPDDTTGQVALSSGATVTVSLYYEGTATGDKYYTGDCLVNSVSRSTSYDGLAEISISVQGTGALTVSTV